MDISQYTGIRIADVLSGRFRDVYKACWDYMRCAFGENVEFERLSRQILLCLETEAYLYQEPDQPVRYVFRSRPVLEQVVGEVTAKACNDRERVLAILRFVRDLYLKVDGEDYFYGGTEEDLIKKGEWFCERVSRLMVALCEVAGYHGRIVFHVTAGHLTSEIFFDGRWAYIDPRCGLFYVNDANQFLSVRDVMQNREVIYQQPKWVEAYHSPYWSYAFRQHRNYHFCLNPSEIQCYGPYSLMDYDQYHFNWRSRRKALIDCETIHNKYVELGKMALIE